MNIVILLCCLAALTMFAFEAQGGPVADACPDGTHRCTYSLYCHQGRCYRAATNCPPEFKPATPWQTCDVTGSDNQCAGDSDKCWSNVPDRGILGICCTPIGAGTKRRSMELWDFVVLRQQLKRQIKTRTMNNLKH